MQLIAMYMLTQKGILLISGGIHHLLINSHESYALASLEEEPDNDHKDLPPRGGYLADNIANLCNQGFDVGDNNEPSPENIPVEDEVPVHDYVLKEGQCWGWDGIDHGLIVKPEKEGHTFTKKLYYSWCFLL